MNKTSYKTLLKASFYWLMIPFKREFPLFILLSVLLAVDNFYYWASLGFVPYGIYIFFTNLLLAYIMTQVVALTKGKVHSIVKWMFIVFAVIWCIVDSFCLTEMYAPFDLDFAMAIRGTTASETSEFIETFFTPRSMTMMAIWLIVGFGLYMWLECKHVRCANWLAYIGLLAIVPGIIMAVRNPVCLKESSVYKTSLLFHSHSVLSADIFNRYPEVHIENTDSLPSNIVLIIGESFSKYHSQLYGYDKDTNPRMQALCDSGRLVVFDDALSAHTSTVQAIRSIMSAAMEVNKKDNWYESPTIPCVFSQAGYRTVWLSNQSKKGVVDNSVSIYGELCDTAVFIGNIFTGTDRLSFDMELIEPLRQIIQHPEAHNLYILHLIGSHNVFAKRYPADQRVFMPNDYPDRPENQREKMSHYDNSILYNDLVLDQVMDLFKDRDAIVFCISDHGYDVYDTNPDYVGQGRHTSEESWLLGRQIPFWIYVSPMFEKKYPERVASLRAESHQPFSTDSLLNFMCRIAKIKLE